LSQICGAHPGAVDEILCDEAFENPEAFSKNVRRLGARQFHSLSSGKNPQGILGIITLPEGVYTPRLPVEPGSRILLLEEVQDPGNVGTLIRTAAAFDFSGVVLSETCADPFSPKAVQSTAGSILSLWIRRTSGYAGLAHSLKQEGFLVAAADIRGESENRLAGEQKIVLALGNEGKGLSNDLMVIADAVIRIPYNHKRAESLNVAAAGAVCMYIIQNA
jgi:TrmH family RNA methyltransferase